MGTRQYLVTIRDMHDGSYVKSIRIEALDLVDAATYATQKVQESYDGCYAAGVEEVH